MAMWHSVREKNFDMCPHRGQKETLFLPRRHRSMRAWRYVCQMWTFSSASLRNRDDPRRRFEDCQIRSSIFSRAGVDLFFAVGGFGCSSSSLLDTAAAAGRSRIRMLVWVRGQSGQSLVQLNRDSTRMSYTYAGWYIQ